MSEITRHRGDTKLIKFKLWLDKAASVPLDVTGYGFRLTVDPEKAPVDSTNNLFSLVGELADAVNGEITFAPTVENMDQTPATYYFDFEVTDAAGKIGTEMLDKFKITQDISK